jgi:hypothetical protein
MQMSKIKHNLSSSNSSHSIKEAVVKYNSSNPVIVNLAYEKERQTGGTMVGRKFMVKRGLVEGREVIKVTFLSSGNLASYKVLYPLEFAKYLAPAFTAVTEGIAASNETNLDL